MKFPIVGLRGVHPLVPIVQPKVLPKALAKLVTQSPSLFLFFNLLGEKKKIKKLFPGMILVGVIGPGVHIYVTIGLETQFEDTV